MQFSLFFFAADSDSGVDGYNLLLESARFADSHKFTAVWTPERHFDKFGGPYPNPAVTGAALAAVTERLSIRAGSVAAPLHHPVRIAEEWAVVDNLSRGRVGLSFASGWHAGDFALRPESYKDRREKLVDAVETVRRLWRGESIVLPDGLGEQRAIHTHPKPVQEELPVWITSSGSADTFKTAGRLGAGVLTYLLGQQDKVIEQNIANYRQVLHDTHGVNAHGHVTAMLHTMLGPSRKAVIEQVREPFHRYLKSSLGLMAKTPGFLPEGVNLDELSDKHIDMIASRAVDRYAESSCLFGTVEDGQAMVKSLAAMGVDEIACLIDFGVSTEEVLRSLEPLAELAELSGQ